MRNLLRTIVILVFGVFFMAGNAMAITIDGNFGLTEWAGYYADGDGEVGPGVGGQAYDVEYLGLYFNSNTVYFGLQTGFDLVKGRDYTSSIHFDPGDFALDVDNNGTYDYAIDFSIAGSNVTYSLYDEVTWENVYYMPQHDVAQPLGMASGNLLTSWTDVDAFGVSGDSYTIEGSFNIAHLLGNGDTMEIHWTMGCGNDYLNQTSSTAPVPEPATMLLFGTGLVGMATVGRKKFRKKS